MKSVVAYVYQVSSAFAFGERTVAVAGTFAEMWNMSSQSWLFNNQVISSIEPKKQSNVSNVSKWTLLYIQIDTKARNTSKRVCCSFFVPFEMIII